MNTLIIHGRQPALGRAELESLYGADKIRPIGNIATEIDLDPAEIDFLRLGSMMKFAKILTVLGSTKWSDIEIFLLETTPEHLKLLPEGKLKIGFSVYDLPTNTKTMQATALKLKKVAKISGRSVRIIPNAELALNSASVLYNKLTGPLGWELLFVRNGNKTIIAQSLAVQDIDAYRRRDRERPYRDSRVGMLPPKLAQLIINLAVGGRKQPIRQAQGKQAVGDTQKITILDPFCGTGVLLQEARLMNYLTYGTDLEPRMIEYSDGNLKWLENAYGQSLPAYHLEVADATSHKWPHGFDTIATETYLGRPLSSEPDATLLQKIVSDCDMIHKKFLQNLALQTNSGFRACIAVPTWAIQNPKLETPKFHHLPILDSLESLGYNRIKFVHVTQDELIYHRPGQIVGRELVVIERK